MRVERRWEPIKPHLETIQSRLSPNIPTFTIEPANDRRWTQERYLAECAKGTFRRYGVYLIFSPDESLQYVGLAMNAFHNRIWSHDDHVVDRQWTDIIALPHEHYFLAPALEFYLIVALRPPMNRVYRDYTIADWSPPMDDTKPV